MSDGTLPPGMVPASGRFRFESKEFGRLDFEVSHAKFVLWKSFENGQETEGVQLDIMIAAQSREIPDESGDADMAYLLAPALTTEWLQIDERQFASRDRAALDGVTVDFDSDRSPDVLEAPAAIQEGSYGSTDVLKLALNHVPPDRYRLQVQATDEFGRSCEIDADLPLFEIGASNFSMSRPQAVEDWVERHFERDGLHVEWRTVGPMTNQWQNLYAAFKETGDE
ncbi:hypothetical protein FIU85_09400 [Roseovarius sp. THAF8]|uniref:hypothetical protein n=1 Tax=Roseovarius sp. THAF8 TaxID=2587846 RepID=UPI001268E32C|nr:hypothetical protein [Roseovarius sp. THAF8]QFT97516.1 hypothetical protein FIU85_09400 [Roseovarius sp. THAF8]